MHALVSEHQGFFSDYLASLAATYDTFADSTFDKIHTYAIKEVRNTLFDYRRISNFGIYF